MAKYIPANRQVGIRMYRTGHGDCFLLAFPREGGGDPVYVLIDCGLKKRSHEYIHGQPVDKIVESIYEATGGVLDIVAVTHEHEDHLNGFWKGSESYFKDFTIKHAWFAWTEDPEDEKANEYRRDHDDYLLGLIRARQKLARLGLDRVQRLDSLLQSELGTTLNRDLNSVLAAGGTTVLDFKKGMRFLKEQAVSTSGAGNGVHYFSPGMGPELVPYTDGVRFYVLGPPREWDFIRDGDPRGPEKFESEVAHGISFASAVAGLGDGEVASPFSLRYHMSQTEQRAAGSFFRRHYGHEGNQDAAPDEDKNWDESTANPEWRRIDGEWLYSAETMALRMSTGVNNTSLVLAFELPETRKVLLFAGDAQRGNWITWDDQTWLDGSERITAKDIMARTVLYKAGHHGSHNATLNGDLDSPYPNISWLAQGTAGREFVALIPAVRKWAMEKGPNWRHPLKSIEDALNLKAQGRVIRTDIGLSSDAPDEWKTRWQQYDLATALYFDVEFEDR